jgi:hypothetical protein
VRWKVCEGFSHLPSLPSLGMGGDKGRAISVFVLGGRMHLGIMCAGWLQGSQPVLAFTFMESESNLPIYKRGLKRGELLRILELQQRCFLPDLRRYRIVIKVAG